MSYINQIYIILLSALTAIGFAGWPFIQRIETVYKVSLKPASCAPCLSFWIALIILLTNVFESNLLNDITLPWVTYGLTKYLNIKMNPFFIK